MAVYFKQYTITGTAASLTSIFDSSAEMVSKNLHFKSAIIKNASGAANNLYVGGSTVTNAPANAGIELAAGQGVIIGDSAGNVVAGSTDKIYLVGTANAANIAFITLVV